MGPAMRVSTDEKQSFIVVGAGISGLVAAAILSRHANVTVHERAPHCGGKIRAERVGNREVDTGPTVFTMRSIFAEAFAAAGGDLDSALSLHPLDILARHFWTGGERLDLFADVDASVQSIREFSGPRDADAYVAFLQDAARTWRTLYEPFLRLDSPSFVRMMLGASPIGLLQLDPYTTYWRSLVRRFRDPRLRQLFARYATYCGSSPFRASSTLKLIAYVEQQGVWSIDGGMPALAHAFEAQAVRNGADFRYSSDVRLGDTQSDDATVIGEGGERHKASAIVFTGDAAAISAAKPLQRSQSAMTWSFLGAAPRGALSTHNVFFSDDYAKEFEAVFDEGAPPEDPTTYLFAPDRFAGDDPPGEERFFCLINAPSNGDVRTYENEELEQCRDNAFRRISSCGVSLNPSPHSTTSNSPATFAERYPRTGGALFGPPSHGWTAPFRRRGVRIKARRLYCAGGSVHPGSGLPMAALSGLTAARAVMADFGLT